MSLIDPIDEPDDEEMAKFEAEANQVNELIQAGAKGAADIGLYAEHAQVTPVHTPFGTKPGVAVVFSLGKIAFSDRIQDPEKDKIDDAIRQSEVSHAQDNFLASRERIAANIKAGRDPLDDGDEDEASDDPFAGLDFDMDFSALEINDGKDPDDNPTP